MTNSEPLSIGAIAVKKIMFGSALKPFLDKSTAISILTDATALEAIAADLRVKAAQKMANRGNLGTGGDS